MESGATNAASRPRLWTAIARVSAMPDVVAVGLAGRTPFSLNYNRSTILLTDRHTTADKGLAVDSTRVSAGYFDAMGIPIVQRNKIAFFDVS